MFETTEEVLSTGQLIAEWQFPARGRQHAFTWRLYQMGHGGTWLTSDTFEAGKHTAWRSGDLADNMRTAEKSARRRNAVRMAIA